MNATSAWHTVNRWGETIYTVPFSVYADARTFTRFISANCFRFSLIGLHRGAGRPWEVSYRPRKESPWKGGVA